MKSIDVMYETLIVCACATGAILAQLLGDAEMPHLPNVDFGNMTSTAILGWYAWHTTTRTIPQIMADFRAEVRELREAFRQELAIERNRHQPEHTQARISGDAKI